MFDIFNMLKKEQHTAPKQVTRDTIIGMKNMTTGEQSLVTPDELLAVVKA